MVPDSVMIEMEHFKQYRQELTDDMRKCRQKQMDIIKNTLLDDGILARLKWYYHILNHRLPFMSSAGFTHTSLIRLFTEFDLPVEHSLPQDGILRVRYVGYGDQYNLRIRFPNKERLADFCVVYNIKFVDPSVTPATILGEPF